MAAPPSLLGDAVHWLVVLLLSVWASAASAEVHRVTVQYVEPTTNTDGSAVTDLALTRIYPDFITDGLSAVPVDVPASSVTGGGAINYALVSTVPDITGVTSLSVTVTAVDLSGNESTMFGPVTLTPLIFETDPVPPPPPQGPIPFGPPFSPFDPFDFGG